MNRQRRVPAEVFHPGSFVREEIEARGWTVQDLSQKTLIREEVLQELVDEKRDMVPGLAHALEDALGVSFGLWMSLQLSWERRTAQPLSP